MFNRRHSSSASLAEATSYRIAEPRGRTRLADKILRALRTAQRFPKIFGIGARHSRVRFGLMAGDFVPSKVHTRHDSANDVSLQFGVQVAIAMQASATDGDD